MSTARYQATATLLPNGKVLVAGGFDGFCCPYDALASAEVYDPNTGTWSPTGPMSHSRAGHTATLLTNGNVLVAGGASGTCCPYTAILSSAELYNPDTGLWTVTGTMASPRYYHTATLLSNGSVLVTGGDTVACCQRTPTASAELYDPNSATWATAGQMSVPRWAHTATMLDSGKVLSAGGADATDTALFSADLYTPPASLTVSPTVGHIGQPLALNGLGFGTSETVLIYANNISVSPIYTATTDASGAFTSTNRILQGSYGLHPLSAIGQTSGISATSSISITPAMYLLHYGGIQGLANALIATGFGAGETVRVAWAPGSATVGQGTTNAQGTAVIKISTPRRPSGLYLLTATGQSTHLTASRLFLLVPTLSITPTSGAAGSAATLSGTGFGANEVVSVRWDCASRTCTSTTILGTIQANAIGDFSGLGVQIPSSTRAGAHALGAFGSAGHPFAATTFNVTP